MRGEALEIGERIIAFFGKILAEIWFDQFTFAKPYFIESSVINSELILKKWVLNSADSKWVPFNHMSKIKIVI